MAARAGMAFRGPGRNPWDTPPISGAPGHGLPGEDVYSTPPIAAPAGQMPYGGTGGEITALPPKPGFSDVGGTADKLRRLAGHLQMIGGIDNSGQLLVDEVDKRQQNAYETQARQQQYQQHRQDEQSDWMARQQWEIAHPKPANNDTINDFNFISQTLGKEAGEQYLRSIASGPPMAVDSIDPVTRDTVRQYIPRGQLPGMAPQGAAPGLPQGFTVRPKGGAGQQAPRTFR